MKSVKLLDCTLRDGAYIVNAEFGTPAIKGIINTLQRASIDIIECGWLKNNPHNEGTSFYHVPSDLEQYLLEKDKNKTYVVMIDWDRYDLDYLPEYDGKSIDAIRVVFPHGRHCEGVEIGKKIKAKGYEVYFQAANTLAYSDRDLLELAEAVNELKPVALSVVDTFGAMYPDDLKHIVGVLDRNMDKSIGLGFHSHNNQQLSFALSMEFVEVLRNSGRMAIVDSSLCGMGRGAGNATTELMVSYLNKTCGKHYDLDKVMDAIDVYVSYYKENYTWGYSTPYFIAGLYCCHVNNIAYLQKNHRTNARDMKNVIESLSPDDRKKYDYDLLEKMYIDNESYKVDDSEAIKLLSENLRNRKILLVAPGKSSIDEQEKINRYITENNPIVIGVNAILTNYKYDFIFFSNSARYEYAKNSYADIFNETKHIVLSNVNTDGEEEILKINFNAVIKRGWVHFDNAVICVLRLMERLGVAEVSISGFDGFKNKYNESYADQYLPTLNPDNKWDELNEEIIDIFTDFKRNAVYCKEIKFITESLFNI